MVERMPRFAGIKCGVKLTTTSRPAAAENSWSSSAMWQRTEGKIERGLLPADVIDRDKLRQLERRELREHRAHLLPGTPVGGEQHNLDMGMAQQQAHQLRAGVAGGAEHADFRLGGR